MTLFPKRRHHFHERLGRAQQREGRTAPKKLLKRHEAISEHNHTGSQLSAPGPCNSSTQLAARCHFLLQMARRDVHKKRTGPPRLFFQCSATCARLCSCVSPHMLSLRPSPMFPCAARSVFFCGGRLELFFLGATPAPRGPSRKMFNSASRRHLVPSALLLLSWMQCGLTRSRIPPPARIFAKHPPHLPKASTVSSPAGEHARHCSMLWLSLVSSTFIQFATKNHPLTLSSNESFIQKHIHPMTLSSKIVSSRTENNFIHDNFIQKRFHPKHFHPKSFSSTFMQKRFHPNFPPLPPFPNP